MPPNQKRARDLADSAPLITRDTLTAVVYEMFSARPSLNAVIVSDPNHEPFLVERNAFALMVPGPTKFGLELYGRRPIFQLPLPPTLRVGVGTALGDISTQMLERSIDARYCDALVVDEVGPVGVLRASAVIEAMSAEFAYQAAHDPLTGLGNRAALKARLTEIATHGRPTAVLFIDLDRFKIVNDSLGHPAGDRLLREVSTRITACLRPDDFPCRLGGDEFVVLLGGMDSVDAAQAVSSRLLAAIREPLVLAGSTVCVTASIGIAVAHAGEEPDDVLLQADLAMYAAKEAGRARQHVFEGGLAVQAGQRFDLESGLRRGLDGNEFFLMYQPIVELATERLAMVEALVRWREPHRGIISPLEFIPMAEENGLIVPLGEWVLREACTQVLDLDPRADGIRLSVNVAARQLAEPGFTDSVERVLAETGFPPDRLTLELTESGASQDVEGLVERLEHLTRMGIGLALDDFGTGFSSLVLLRELPLTNLKIDRTFVERIAASYKEAALVRLTIEMAHALGLVVTAEGVEDDYQRTSLLAMKCQLAQGYLFDRPLSIDALRARLESSTGPDIGQRSHTDVTIMN